MENLLLGGDDGKTKNFVRKSMSSKEVATTANKKLNSKIIPEKQTENW